MRGGYKSLCFQLCDLVACKLSKYLVWFASVGFVVRMGEFGELPGLGTQASLGGGSLGCVVQRPESEFHGSSELEVSVVTSPSVPPCPRPSCLRGSLIRWCTRKHTFVFACLIY